MQEKFRHIYPVFDELISREAKENLLNQKGLVFWFTGLSGSGKTTLAKGFEQSLHKAGYLTQVLDGDNIRSGLNKNLGFDAHDRTENIRRIAEVAKLFADCGVITICSFVSPEKAMRKQAADIIGKDFHEIYIKASVEACTKRDTKGLYKKALKGEIEHFTGVSAPYDEPESPFLTIDTEINSIEECVQEIIDVSKPLLQKK